jgi:hypothetical protein
VQNTRPLEPCGWPRATGDAHIWLKEEIETGALDRMMQTPPADETGIIWTTWEDTDQD